MSATAGVAARGRTLTGKQVMSILGLVPLGAYVVAHLWTNMYSLAGAEAFDAKLVASRSSPALIFLEVFGLGLPIIAHTWIGIAILRTMRPNNTRYGTLRNLKYFLQRVAGVGVLLFLGAHVIKARILPAMSPVGHETWAGMHEALSEPLTFGVYALGLLGISYHLANGLWGSSLTLGLAVTPRAQARMEWISAVAFVVLLAMCGLALYGFHPFQA
jgi:succinate dehydrogenase / fumarate reductase cytochrome b subunit